MDLFHKKEQRASTVALILISMVLVLFSYCRSVSRLDSYSDSVLYLVQVRTRDLYIYSFLPFITFGPAVVSILLKSIFDFENEIFDDVLGIFSGLSGFFNSMAYFFQRMNLRKMSVIRRSTECYESMTDDRAWARSDATYNGAAFNHEVDN